MLLGAPTGSGKTISSELAMMRLWEAHPGDKVGFYRRLTALGFGEGFRMCQGGDYGRVSPCHDEAVGGRPRGNVGEA